jgi:hypothetical protein
MIFKYHVNNAMQCCAFSLAREVLCAVDGGDFAVGGRGGGEASVDEVEFAGRGGGFGAVLVEAFSVDVAVGAHFGKKQC